MRIITMAKIMKKTKIFNPEVYLENKEDVILFISEALKTNNLKYIAHAFDVAAKSKGKTELINVLNTPTL